MRAIVATAFLMGGLLPGANAQPIYYSHFAGDPDSPGSADGSGAALLEPSSTTITRFVPIVLDVDNGSAHFTTELTLTNDTTSPIQVAATYTPSLGSREGGGTVSAVTVTGLRSSATGRSNLAVVNLSDFPVTFDVAVQDGDVGGRLVVVRRGETLPAWGWMQVNSAELLDASFFRNGYGLVQQRSAGAALYAYGVVNDRRTNDASFLEPFRISSDPNDLFLPVAVEVNGLSTELTMTNTGIRSARPTVTYQESLSSHAGAGGIATFRTGDGSYVPMTK